VATTFHHAGLVVPDLEQADRFYRHLLGLEELFRFEWDDSSDLPVAEVINLAGRKGHNAQRGELPAGAV